MDYANMTVEEAQAFAKEYIYIDKNT